MCREGEEELVMNLSGFGLGIGGRLLIKIGNIKRGVVCNSLLTWAYVSLRHR